MGSRAIAGLVLVCSAAGCGGIGRVHDCQSIVEVVNGGLAELHVMVPDAGDSAAAYAAIADGYDALGRQLAALAPGDPPLAKALDSYRELTDRAAKASRAYAEALAAPAASRRQRGDRQARLERIRADAQSDLSREVQVVRKLNALCHPQ